MPTTHRRFGIVFVSILLLLATAAQVAAQPPAETELETFKTTIVLIHGETDSKRSYEVLSMNDGRPASLRVGNKMPILSVSHSNGSDRPTTSYQYQDIGFAARAQVEPLDNGKLMLTAEISDSRVVDAEHAYPTIATYSRDVRAIVEPGEELTLSGGEGSEEQGLTVVLRVDRME